MPTLHIPVYIADKDMIFFTEYKKELREIAREAFKAKFEEIKNIHNKCPHLNTVDDVMIDNGVRFDVKVCKDCGHWQ